MWEDGGGDAYRLDAFSAQLLVPSALTMTTIHNVGSAPPGLRLTSEEGTHLLAIIVGSKKCQECREEEEKSLYFARFKPLSRPVP